MNKTVANILLLLMALIVSHPAYAQGQLREYDCEIIITTEPMKEFLRYQGSSMHPMIRAAVSYKDMDKNAVTQYEELWYRGCEAMGCKRLHRFQVQAGDGVAIRVKHKNNSADNSECCAASNAIVRLLLDAYLNS